MSGKFSMFSGCKNAENPICFFITMRLTQTKAPAFRHLTAVAFLLKTATVLFSFPFMNINETVDEFLLCIFQPFKSISCKRLVCIASEACYASLNQTSAARDSPFKMYSLVCSQYDPLQKTFNRIELLVARVFDAVVVFD